MVDELGAFAGEVMRLANEVGVEGRLGGQADVRGLSGTWRDLTDGFNSMANNLTQQVRNISQVASAIAEGDLRKKIVVDARGEIQELKNTINTMVDQLRLLADEVTRVAREVGTEGKLGGQASVEGVRGDWKELANNVNQMASNLTNQVRDIASVSSAIAAGNLSRKVTVEVRGEIFDLKNTINTMVDQLSAFAAEVTILARDVGEEGRLGGQARVPGASGIWKELTDNVNLLTNNLTNQVRDIAMVTTAVANGSLNKKITVEVKGEILELKNTINTMVDQLRSFASEVTRVAREVGTEGRLGGQAEVRDVSGTWRELTDNVNIMAENLTGQVRGIARVVTAVANGDLKQRLTLDVRGEIATLVATINDMTVTLSTFADQVTSVARDVGVEGRLGGQADVPGAAGIWRELTNNVNELASNLTRQVRAIGDVATAVTKGDLTQSISVEARGELALLKDNLNQMILALAQTTRTNQEQDWLKTNLARFTRMLQGQRDLATVARQVLSELAPVVGAQHGAFYVARNQDDQVELHMLASYAYKRRKSLASTFALGEGLVGQAALEKTRIGVDQVPADYVQISSGLGEASPMNLVVVPILFESEVRGVIELASFDAFTPIELDFLDQLLESLGIVVATIEATMRTDDLLRQSQGLTEELQSQQEELQQTNEELEEKARQLTLQKQEVEAKNKQIEIAKEQLEEKASQLSLTSRYKSEFLANMSHELRTPLNSLLILSKQLADNRNNTLTEKEISYAKNIHQAGFDLLSLINEILDLAKIESGTMHVEVANVHLTEVVADLDRMFRQVASDKSLSFEVTVSPTVPGVIRTDELRLKQVLRNLLSNAFKFTERGGVTLLVEAAQPPSGSSEAEATQAWMRFAVTDTGIGIPKDKHRIIFEAFQQVDGGSNRRFGGTGLGLSISREIAGLLGGELGLKSAPGEGSCFSLYIPTVLSPNVLPTQRDESRQAVTPLPPSVSASSPSGNRRATSVSPPVPPPSRSGFADDRHSLTPGDRVILIIEDDPTFAEVLLGAARDTHFKGVIAGTGEEGLSLASALRPDAITLDLLLPDVAGWVVLDRLKHSADTRHIPVQVISGSDQRRRSLETGALAFLRKPVEERALKEALEEIGSFLERQVKRLLLVEDDELQRDSILALIGERQIETVAVQSGEDALAQLDTEKHFDCMVTDLRLPGMSGFELLDQIKNRARLRHLPIIVYTAKDLSRREETDLRRLSDTIIVKDVRSPERLLEETTLFLHQVEARLTDEQQTLLRRGIEADPTLRGKRILVVDDDVRNVFAVTAVLERYEMKVTFAENGAQALAKLQEDPSIDAILMDIMMPEMDGYEATRQIRSQERFADTPIIALTAKAMQGDREKCLEAGASDYITKPINSDQLVSLLRVWLYE
jgi:CheY-like chemotaxis protein/HAMP domain-containing protein